MNAHIGGKAVASSNGDNCVRRLTELGNCSARTVGVADLSNKRKEITAPLKDPLHGVSYLASSGNGAWSEGGQNENLTKLQQSLVGRLGGILGKYVRESHKRENIHRYLGNLMIGIANIPAILSQTKGRQSPAGISEVREMRRNLPVIRLELMSAIDLCPFVDQVLH
jgi:hypothetical protein